MVKAFSFLQRDRQTDRQTYAQPKLWTTLERASLKPPRRAAFFEYLTNGFYTRCSPDFYNLTGKKPTSYYEYLTQRGACGETGPVEQKQADTTVTERLGRQVTPVTCILVGTPPRTIHRT